MSIDRAKAFRDFLDKNDELRQEVDAKLSAGESIDWSSLAATHGYDITKDDVESVAREMGWDGEMAEAEMETVSGGGVPLMRKFKPVDVAMAHNRRLSPFDRTDFSLFAKKRGKG